MQKGGAVTNDQGRSRSFLPPLLLLFRFPVAVFVPEHGDAIGAEPGLGQGRFELDAFEMEL